MNEKRTIKMYLFLKKKIVLNTLKAVIKTSVIFCVLSIIYKQYKYKILKRIIHRLNINFRIIFSLKQTILFINIQHNIKSLDSLNIKVKQIVYNLNYNNSYTRRCRGLRLGIYNVIKFLFT